MSWVRLEDHFDEHPKQLKIGALGTALWTKALAYCNRQPAHDGVIPQEKVATYRDGDMRKPLAIAERLVAAGCWERVDGGFKIHDYHGYQPTADEVAAAEEERREMKRRAGLASAAARRARYGTAQPVRSPNSCSVPVHEQPTEHSRTAPNPVPVPVPEEDTTSEKSIFDLGHARSLEAKLAPTSGAPPAPSVERQLLLAEDQADRPARREKLGVRTLFPTDLALTPRMRVAIEAVGCRDPDAAFQHFRDVHTKNASKYAEWEGAVWRTFVANHNRFGCPCQQAAGGVNAPPRTLTPSMAAVARVGARIAQRAGGGES